MSEHPKHLPAMVAEDRCESPHVMILGAGATRASFPQGDARGVAVPLMPEMTDALGAEKLLEGLWKGPEENFEELFSRLHAEDPDAPVLRCLENLVWDFFDSLESPEEATLYDHLLLSLRDKDFIATFNWDPFLAWTYKRNRELRRLPRIAFLHGNVRVGACMRDKRKGFFPGQRCAARNRWLQPVPLLYPVAQKDYANDAFIKNEWEEARHFLENAYLLTIFGYGAPDTDAEAVDLLLKAWDANRSKELAEVEIIDIKSRSSLEATWQRFIVREHRQIRSSVWESLSFFFPRRSCDAFAARTLMNRPWRECPLPSFTSLSELQDWVQPLIEEEDQVDGTNRDFDPQLCPDTA